MLFMLRFFNCENVGIIKSFKRDKRINLRKPTKMHNYVISISISYGHRYLLDTRACCIIFFVDFNAALKLFTKIAVVQTVVSSRFL